MAFTRLHIGPDLFKQTLWDVLNIFECLTPLNGLGRSEYVPGGSEFGARP